MDIDQMCQDEIDSLDGRISSAQVISDDIKSLFKETQIIKHHLDAAQEFSNRRDYTNAYKSLLNSMSKLIDINQQILDKYTNLTHIVKDQDGPQTKD